MHTVTMLARLIVSQAVLAAALLAAQQPAAPAQNAAAAAAPAQKLSSDPAKLTNEVLGSYYHPDDLPGLDCDVAPDWQQFFSSAKLTVPPDRMQAVQALKIHVRAIRGETPVITFNWSEVRIATADQVEAGMRQSIDGFFQMYWPMFASPIIKNAGEISRIEPQPDGSTKLYASDPNNRTIITVGTDGTPTEFTFATAAMSGTIDSHYVPSPHPAAGDLRRLSSIDVDDHIGASSMKVTVSLDYQPLDTYFVPKHVAFNVIGAYTLAMEYSGCSVISGAEAGE